MAIFFCSRSLFAAETESAKGHYSLTAFVSTTVGYQPHKGDFEGPQKDITPGVGVGYNVTETVGLEFSLYPTFTKTHYDSFALSPGVVWAFHPNFYVDYYFLVQLDPETDLAVLPGVGWTFALDNGISPYVEGELFSYVGRGKPDLGIVMSAGASYQF